MFKDSWGRGYQHRGMTVLSRSRQAPADFRPDWANLLGVVDATESSMGPFDVATWGGFEPTSGAFDGAIGLGHSPRAADRDLVDEDIRHFIDGQERNAGRTVLPPFAAIGIDDRRLRAKVDDLGFMHLYGRQFVGSAAISTSARSLSLLGGDQLNHQAVAVQALVGWQLGLRTMFENVEKIPPGGSVDLQEGVLGSSGDHGDHRGIGDQNPVKVAARIVREFINAYLDDHPDAELQLTGGLDSRILLAAVTPSRRHQLTAMTLTVPDSEDGAIASHLSGLFGMRHKTSSLQGLAGLEPADAFNLCLTAARRVDSAADPIALAAVDFAELALEPAPRIAGLGGEVARGFYYFGPVRTQPVTRRRVERLARWRILANEAVPRQMLDAGFAAWADAFVVDDLTHEMMASGHDWFRSLDDFYLGQRMHRWAGVLASATALERSVVNPMLDPEFLAVVRGVSPAEKKNARFLSRILVELDEDLARIPMDGRPAPIAYARAGAASQARIGLITAGKVGRKVRQRVRREHRSPEGGTVLSQLVLHYLRDNPELLESLLPAGVLDERWLDQLVTGNSGVETSAVALLINLLACGATATAGFTSA